MGVDIGHSQTAVLKGISTKLKKYVFLKKYNFLVVEFNFASVTRQVVSGAILKVLIWRN